MKKKKMKTPRVVEIKYSGQTIRLNPRLVSKTEVVKLEKWAARVLKWKKQK